MTTAATTTATDAIRYLLTSEIHDEINEAREWMAHHARNHTATVSQLARQRRHISALQAELARRASMDRDARLAEESRQSHLRGRELAEAAELETDESKAAAMFCESDSWFERGERLMDLADRAGVQKDRRQAEDLKSSTTESLRQDLEDLNQAASEAGVPGVDPHAFDSVATLANLEAIQRDRALVEAELARRGRRGG